MYPDGKILFLFICVKKFGLAWLTSSFFHLNFQDVFADTGRLHLFERAKIETALAVPVFSSKSANTPAFVFCCYSFVRTGSVPFVLKFVQQALKLLWSGLDKVQPHESVGEDIWRDVAPADLGEMAADVEMQQHFIIKKRPIAAITEEPYSQDYVGDSLAAQIQSLETPSGAHSVRSIYTGAHASSDYGSEDILPSPIQPIHYQTFESVQNHIQDAIKSVADMQPLHQHVATNATGSKRAHVFHQEAPQPFNYQQEYQQQQQQSYGQPQQTFVQQQEEPTYSYEQSQGYLQQQAYPQQQQQQSQEDSGSNNGFLPAVSAPLALPKPLPSPNQATITEASPAFSYRHHPTNSLGSLGDLLQEAVDSQQGMSNFNAVPDQVYDNVDMINNQQSYSQQNYDDGGAASFGAPAAPNQVYSVPVDQLSATGITFAVPLPQTNSGGTNGMGQTPQFCMPAQPSGGASGGSGKVRLTQFQFQFVLIFIFPYFANDCFSLSYCILVICSAAESKGVVNQPCQGGHIVSIIVEIECVNMRAVQNVLRGLLAFALLMVVVAVVLTLAVTRVLEISSFVQPMAEESVADTRVATSLQLEDPVFAQPTEVEEDVQLMDAISLRNLRQSSVSNMEVEKNVVILDAKRLPVAGLNIVLL